MANYSSDDQLEWERTRHIALRSDAIWSLDAYRAALYFRHLAKPDCAILRQRRPDDDLAAQLADSSGSISSNIAEGYGRGTLPDRRRFYGYALGSTRECVTWYEDSRGDLPPETIDARQLLLARIRALVLGLIGPRDSDEGFDG
ncbi:MAG: four helix bundle protein [Gemmatimonadaceae bacterium]